MTIHSASRVATRYLEAIRFPPMPRLSYIPTHMRDKARLVESDGTDLAIWVWEDRNQYMGIAFQGTANKPLWYNIFKNERAREAQINRTIAARKARLQQKVDRLQERKEFQHDIEVGDIFYTSWGYDQTNVNFFEVIALRGKAVVIREVGSKIVHEGQGSNSVVAVPGVYVGPPQTKVPQMGNTFRVDRQIAYRWDGKPKYETAWGYGH